MPDGGRRTTITGAVSRAWLLTGLLALLPAHADISSAPAAKLRSAHARLAPQLQNSQFNRPLYLDSVEMPNRLKGDIYALLDHPFTTVSHALNDPSGKPVRWCELLGLELNVKYCRADEGGGRTLNLYIGRKIDQPLDEAYPMTLQYRVLGSAKDYFAVGLDAAEGPLGTRDYHILVEAIPVGQRTFMHLSYDYGYGKSSKLLMKSYLATLGRHKVGFTVVGREKDGSPKYIGGMRGVVERNAMRYYLTVDAYLRALALPPGEQLEKRLEYWFDATEQYARQLHEVERDEYLAMKRHEYLRQQEGTNAAAR